MLPESLVLIRHEIWTPHRKWGTWALKPRTIKTLRGPWVKYRIDGNPRTFCTGRINFERWISKTKATRHNPFLEEN